MNNFPMTNYPNMNQSGQQSSNAVMPNFSIPSDKEAQEAYDGNGEGGPKVQFMKFPLPNGIDWKVAPVGAQTQVLVYILPSPAVQQGQQPAGIFYKNFTHFWKSTSHPKGWPMVCLGKETCLVCKSRELALASNDPEMHKRATSWAKCRVNYLYQVVVLSDPTQHKVNLEGAKLPVILQAGYHLHTAIGNIIKVRGLGQIVDPRCGRPLLLGKKKTGPLEANIEYSAIDSNPMPLPPEFYDVLNNLYSLKDINSAPSQEQMIAAVVDMQLPLPNGIQVNPPAPTNGSGIPAPWQVPNVSPMNTSTIPGVTPINQNLPNNIPNNNFPGIPASLPNTFSGVSNVSYPNPIPLPTTGNSMPSGMGYTMMGVVPNQPMVNSTGVPTDPMLKNSMPVGTGFQTASPNGLNQVVPNNFVTAASVPANDQPHLINLPVTEALPGAKERCFSHFNEQDMQCSSCPVWIKQQCVGYSPKQKSQEEILRDLQNQLLGGQK